jgi:predicted dehydrogenase/threonine dehydrogenase-like Zn-dependent dehydrogenase
MEDRGVKQIFMRKNLLSRASLVAEEVPVPRAGARSVLIANRYSLISAGTETASVRRNKKDMVVKALTSPALRQAVKDMVHKDGILKTAERVEYEMTKWTPLGYSGAGVALEVGKEVDGIEEGGLVAYGGEGHAEFIRASRNLCVRVPEGVTAREAAFVALGSIALQAVRRAEVQVGEVAAVLGLGIVGQLVAQLLVASGGRVLVSDVIPRRLELARGLGAERGFAAGEALPREIIEHTRGVGADRVLICASTPSNAVIDQAVEMSRDRGRIVVVGAVGLDVPHEKFYYKELELLISRSYGPGRYDPHYEEHGNDYPIGYVRWTEKRNMEEFLRLLASGKVDVKPLITHELGLGEVERAYEMLATRAEECLAILLRYDESPDPRARRLPAAPPRAVAATGGARANIAVIGCGSFARQFHLPNLRRSRELNLRTLVTSSGHSAKEMALRYGAEYCATDWREALADGSIDAVMVLARDGAHAGMALEALAAGKHVFCEKPLATTYAECRRLHEALAAGGPLCMVGFNRRFSPLVRKARELLAGRSGPAMLHYRVNAGALPKGHWIYDPAHAAGRIVGEACHFIDLFRHLLGCEPVEVQAQALGVPSSLAGLEDTSAAFRFADGSLATILYTAAGSTSFPKERLEAFFDGTALGLDDYRRLVVRGKRTLDLKSRSGDKGHGAELEHFARALLGSAPLEVTHHDGIRATVCCLRLFESIQLRAAVEIDLAAVLEGEEGERWSPETSASR